MATTFSIEHHGTTGIVRIHGDLTPTVEDELSDAWATASADGSREVVLDFSGLEYMNSGGIGLLVQLLVQANRTRHGLAATGLSGHYRQIFRVTRLDEAIAIRDDVEAAVSAS